MANQADKKSNYISRCVQQTNALLDAVHSLEALSQEGVFSGYVAPPGSANPGSLQDADFVGANGFLNAATFGQVMATLAALDGQLHADGGKILQALYLMRQ